MDPYLHYELLQRTHRALALRAIINEHIKPGMRVLDAGCGSGILSMWAALTGATVVGVDLADTTLAQRLVAENVLNDRVRIVQGDLFKVDLGDAAPFDALLAMVYLNDPRRDEDRPTLVHGLKQFLKPDALIVPDRVRYTAAPLDWPAQRSPDRWSRLATGVAGLEDAYGLRMRRFQEMLSQRPNKSLFPHRGPDGMLDLSGATMLATEHVHHEEDLRNAPTSYPSHLRFTFDRAGEFNVVLWEQELLFQGASIFRNRSIGWVDPPALARVGASASLPLDQRWRRDNLLSVA